jgi:ppGpp synthetase/RelA/SpoT-type nucleotidyltranferase
MPTRQPIFPPTTKSQADKAGRRMREYLQGTRQPSDDFPDLIVTLMGWRAMHSRPLSLVTPGVRNWVSKQTAGRVTVAQRLKRWDRMIFKLKRFPSMRLSQMEDIAGCRAVLLDPGEVEAVAKRIRSKWKVREESDYRNHGKEITGYRGLHLTIAREGLLVEVQLRTEGQHYWAEQAERTSSRTGFNLKDGEGPAELLDYFRVASDLTWLRENKMAPDKDLQDELSKLRESVRPYFRR